MALTHHEDITMMIGDEWLIIGTLLDEDGLPIDLLASGTTAGWTLLGGDGDQLPGIAEAATLDRQADGVVRVVVSDSFTRTLDPGRYMNSIRVWIDGEPATYWAGHIIAEADPFHVAQSPEPEPELLAPRRLAPPPIEPLPYPQADEPMPAIYSDRP
jgi:hypothetical protein